MAEESKKEVQSTPARTMTPFDEMDRMMNRFFRRGWMRPWRFEWPTFPEMEMSEMKVPSVDVVDRENEVVVKAEVPGVDKKDLDISVGEDSVTIKGETHHEEKEEKGDYYRREISSGSFSRTVPLPATVDGAKAKANFHDGMLELTIPKVEKAKRHNVKVD
jgi:HSP20 family protein